MTLSDSDLDRLFELIQRIDKTTTTNSLNQQRIDMLEKQNDFMMKQIKEISGFQASCPRETVVKLDGRLWKIWVTIIMLFIGNSAFSYWANASVKKNEPVKIEHKNIDQAISTRTRDR